MTGGVHWRADLFARAFHDRVLHGAGFMLAKDADGEETMYATWMGGQDYQNASPMYGAYPKGFLQGALSLFPDAKRILHLFSGSLTADQVRNARTGPEPVQLRFDNGRHPAAAAAKPDIIGDAEQLSMLWARYSGGVRDVPLFDLILADPPYRLPDQRRYWRESMWALDDSSKGCTKCGWLPSAHKPVYLKSTREGRLLCPIGPELSKLIWELDHSGYMRFQPLKKKLVIQQAAAVLAPGGWLVWLDEIRPPYDNERWRFRGGICLVRSTNHRIRYATFLERR